MQSITPNLRHATASCVLIALLLPAIASTATAARLPDREPVASDPVTSEPVLVFCGSGAKAAVDTITLMGPGGAYPFRGDFETALPLPYGDGQLTDGWVSVDQTMPVNHWHVAAYNNPGTGNGAWCGDPGIASCDGGATDPVGGYANGWYDVLEFRKTVSGDATVRLSGVLRYDTEPGYDFVTLVRRTATAPGFEVLAGGQGLTWDGAGTTSIDYTFSYTQAELVAGTDIAVAFVFHSDGGWSDADCSWPSAGAAIVDNLAVTVTSGTAATYTEDFEDGSLGPDWMATPSIYGVGDYARVWNGLCDADPCNGNNTKQLAFIEPDPALWPSPAPNPCAIINNIGTERGMSYRMYNTVNSPVMSLPVGAGDGLTLAFDHYWNQVRDTYVPLAGLWGVRSTAGGDITAAPWVNRDSYLAAPPEYSRKVEQIGDLLVPGATAVQVCLGIAESGWCYGCYVSDAGRSTPFFDNVNVKAYPAAGPLIVITEYHLANDGFPAGGVLDLANPGLNSVRFDMAKDITVNYYPSTNPVNDPGDSVVIKATPRNGGTLDMPVMHWTLARRNPVFDAWRTLPANPVTGRVVRLSNGILAADRYSFDLPDTGMLFPGDVLQYYFAATDHVGSDARTTTAPQDISGFGDATPQAYPGMFTVRCLPTVAADGTHPGVLFWNDNGFRGGEDEWYGALRAAGLTEGVDYDTFTTHAANSSTGIGNGLGGRASVAQVGGYTDLLYTSGDASLYLLSDGDPARGDRGSDLALLNGWLALGDRDLLLCGDNLANNLVSSAAGVAFRGSAMGVDFGDGDVKDDIDGQTSPLVVAMDGNPVFTTAASWLVYGGCPAPNGFDRVSALPGAVPLAGFTAPDGVSTPYPYAAAVLNTFGTNRVVSLPFDLMYIMSFAKDADWRSSRGTVLANVLDYFGARPGTGDPTSVPAATAGLVVAGSPNPFNPSLNLHYTLGRPGHVKMKVFDARGALVRTLLDGPVVQATGIVQWDGTTEHGESVSSGLYFVETRADGLVDVRKVTMLK